MFDERLLQAHGEDSAFPRDWRVMSLADVCEQVTDGSHFSPKPQAQGCPIANVKDLEDGRVDIESCTKIKEEDFHALIRNGCDVRKHDVLLSKDGTIGRVVIYQQDEPLVALSSIAVLRPGEAINPSFLGQVLQSAYVNRQFSLLAGGSALRRLVLRDINRILVPTPPLKDQLQIAAVLETADEAIAKTEAVIAKLKQVRAGLLHDLLTRGLDEHGQLRDPIAHPERFKDSPVGMIPKEWEVVRLEEKAGVFGGKRLPSGHSYAELPTGYRYLRVLDFYERAISFDDLVHLRPDTFAALSRYEIRDGELFISIAGSLGYVGVLRVPNDDLIILTENAARIHVNSGFIPEFLGLLMNSNGVQLQISAEKGIGAGVPKLALFRIESLWLGRPEEEEQAAIVNAVADLDRGVESERRELAKLGLIKSGLMTDLLTGRVRVPESLSSAEAHT